MKLLQTRSFQQLSCYAAVREDAFVAAPVHLDAGCKFSD
ncbi:hypothetical protein PC119_g23631 [Phytophthora cactorum]|nr:hypothetical protein PC114_g2976 [Phytophthora cactorum]KAG2970541.1 hypothetical protein PC119_g23631 [Phytophthora cactorum]KAG3165133.1 hypothetical protein C6341_g12458 [Phytophthora cactorum]